MWKLYRGGNKSNANVNDATVVPIMAVILPKYIPSGITQRRNSNRIIKRDASPPCKRQSSAARHPQTTEIIVVRVKSDVVGVRSTPSVKILSLA
jgi:hypothetical protein